HAQLQGREPAPVAGQDHPRLVDLDGLEEADLHDELGEPVYLVLGVEPGVVRIGDHPIDRPEAHGLHHPLARDRAERGRRGGRPSVRASPRPPLRAADSTRAGYGRCGGGYLATGYPSFGAHASFNSGPAAPPGHVPASTLPARPQCVARLMVSVLDTTITCSPGAGRILKV